MTGRFLLSLLFLCQGLLFISAAYTEELEDGVKVQETDWVDISADLANVDDDTPDNSQGIDDDEAMLEDLQLTNDDDDDDDNSDGDDNVMKFDDDSITSNNEDIPEDSYPIETQSEDVSANRLCRRVSLTIPFLNRAVCRVGVPAFVKLANNIRIPNIRRRRFRLYRIGVSGTNVGSCSVTGGGSRKTVSISNMRTQVYGRYRYKRGWFRIRGSVRVRVIGVSVRLSFNDRTQPNGSPALSNLTCNSSIRRVKIRVRGGLVGRIINLFRRRIGRTLRSLLNRQICNVARKFMMKRLF